MLFIFKYSRRQAKQVKCFSLYLCELSEMLLEMHLAQYWGITTRSQTTFFRLSKIMVIKNSEPWTT